jgi:hypothetical protein
MSITNVNENVSISIDGKKKSSALSEYFKQVNKDEFAKNIYKHSRQVEKNKQNLFQNTKEYKQKIGLDALLSNKLINIQKKVKLETKKNTDFHQYFLDQNIDLIKNRINLISNRSTNKKKKLISSQSNLTNTVIIDDVKDTKSLKTIENEIVKNTLNNEKSNSKDFRKDLEQNSNEKKLNTANRIKKNLFLNTDEKKVKFVYDGKYILRDNFKSNLTKSNNNTINNDSIHSKSNYSLNKNLSNSLFTKRSEEANFCEKGEKTNKTKIKSISTILKDQNERMKIKTSNFLVYGNYMTYEKQKNELILKKLKETISNFEKDFKEDDPVLIKVKNFLSTVSAPEPYKNGTYYQVGQGFETLSSKKNSKSKIISDEKFNIFYRLFFINNLSSDTAYKYRDIISKEYNDNNLKHFMNAYYMSNFKSNRRLITDEDKYDDL